MVNRLVLLVQILYDFTYKVSLIKKKILTLILFKEEYPKGEVVIRTRHVTGKIVLL